MRYSQSTISSTEDFLIYSHSTGTFVSRLYRSSSQISYPVVPPKHQIFIKHSRFQTANHFDSSNRRLLRLRIRRIRQGQRFLGRKLSFGFAGLRRFLHSPSILGGLLDCCLSLSSFYRPLHYNLLFFDAILSSLSLLHQDLLPALILISYLLLHCSLALGDDVSFP